MATKNNTPADGAFEGFSKDGLDFLKKLAKNNKREWFLPRKPFFEQNLQKPMAQLMAGIEREMAKGGIPLAANPKAVLFRIYRDVRFRADKSPYHTHVSGALYRNGKKNSQGVLYVHIAEKEQYVAAGFYQPERPTLTNWRLGMQDEPKRFLAMIRQLKQKKLELSAMHTLQRMPRGFESLEASPLAEFLKLQSFVVSRPISSSETMSPELPRQLARFALDAKPLLEYGWSLPETKPAVFID